MEAGPGLAVQASRQGVAVLTGLALSWRATPELAVGAYGEVAPLFEQTLKCPDDCEYSVGRPFLLGALIEGRLRPRSFVEPWLRLSGGMLYTGSLSADADVRLGVDFCWRGAAAGPFIGWMTPSSDDQPKTWVSLRVRVLVPM